MIRNEAEYQEASKRLFEELGRLDEHRARLKEAGLGEIEIQRVIDPLESFHLQLKDEAEAYERLKRGEFEELENLRGLARAPTHHLPNRPGHHAARSRTTSRSARDAGLPR